MNRSLRKTAYGLLAAFVVLLGSVVWIQAVQGADYRDDPRNPRLVAWRTGRERGPIVTADDVLVAISSPSGTGANTYQREYPEGPMYAHTVGYTSVLFGTTGIEKAWSSTLLSDRDATISGVLNALLGGDPRPRGLRLTIDHELQAAAAEALGDQKGAVVAIDPRTGAILALVSNPTFDPNSLVDASAFDAGEALSNDPDEPLRNRVTDESYPPGSVFKVVTATAGFDAGVVSPSSEFDDPLELELPGSAATISNFGGTRCNGGSPVALEAAFVRSCNTVFAQLGMNVGGRQLAITAQRFGFDSDIPFDLPTLMSRFPNGDALEADPAATAQTAIGQRDVQTTPLLMALAASAVANDGLVMEPYLVSEVFTSSGEIELRAEPRVWRRSLSPATASVLASMMEQVVISGTGTKAAVPGVRIGGKTGTAEVTGSAPHAWFIGFGPVDAASDEATIAIAVVVESGGSFGESATGGSTAAPIAQRVLAAFFGVPVD